MTEKETYQFDLQCVNCLKKNKLYVPFRKTVKEFLSEGKECWYCGCKLVLEEKQ